MHRFYTAGILLCRPESLYKVPAQPETLQNHHKAQHEQAGAQNRGYNQQKIGKQLVHTERALQLCEGRWIIGHDKRTVAHPERGGHQRDWRNAQAQRAADPRSGFKALHRKVDHGQEYQNGGSEPHGGKSEEQNAGN